MDDKGIHTGLVLDKIDINNPNCPQWKKEAYMEYEKWKKRIE